MRSVTVTDREHAALFRRVGDVVNDIGVALGGEGFGEPLKLAGDALVYCAEAVITMHDNSERFDETAQPLVAAQENDGVLSEVSQPLRRS